MSMNICIIASAKCTIHLKNRNVASYMSHSFDCFQTRTEKTMEILCHKDVNEQLNAYKEWVKSSFTEKCGGYIWDPNDPSIRLEFFEDDEFNWTQIPVGDSVRVDERTAGEAHIDDLNLWLKDHEGWDIEVTMI